jgi:hypothetical protein
MKNSERITKGWRVRWRLTEAGDFHSSRIYHSKPAADVLKSCAEAQGYRDAEVITVGGYDDIAA